MERIIAYQDLPYAKGQSIYFRMETDPSLYVALLSKGYKLVKEVSDTKESTIYLTGRRQDYHCKNTVEYKNEVTNRMQKSFEKEGIRKPKEEIFSFQKLFQHQYSLPFVLKNENQNGGREKFLIQTEEDYENFISACEFLIQKNYLFLGSFDFSDPKCQLDYKKYLTSNFVVQEYVKTPSKYNTTVRILTSPSEDVLYAALKYKEKVPYQDQTTLLGYLLSEVYPLSSPSIVSNTLRGGKNILLGENNYSQFETSILESHHIPSKQFYELMKKTLEVHKSYQQELGILCGFDYIYDEEKEEWFLLEYHSRPMVGDYSKRQNLPYKTKEQKVSAEGRVRATALSLVLKKR